MSYASVAAHNAPPPSHQPHADPALLTTEPPSANNIADDAAKPSGYSKKQHAKDKTRRYVHEAEQEGFYLYHVAKDYLLRPGVAGGLLGLLNLGLLTGAGYAYYKEPHLRRDTRAITSTVAAFLAVAGVESYATEKYRKTPRGQDAERRARQEGSALYRYAREYILRPGVLGGILGVVNAAVLGTVGYFTYTNWDRPRWDKRVVSAVSAGLLTLWSGEGYLAERYRQTHH